ncbi:TetR/AcrR family transcriptional regulator C-terminal domain-containing protein [Actinomadura sp. ATCC 31491]|uniref:TetR/AcrR family transcriptional regulator C-terminal domain-containing protein n=1 Tax=Actinomadura luzonensis TaxID=2805427 RepID=A0ABT0G372_9ACTN|nr:TetR/AcrR family transcriptional regulator C-terminal domain-containing protein [Actinomadura luzonensis]MCK2218853.1 TetR/AcrR family transcriptional regulator C-terminal domain-containing protein [Actinomadura luzonensis]
MPRREPLNREKVLDAALALADAEGLDGLSMRRLAKTLGVEAMSLYNHVAGKADLLEGLVERVFAEVDPPDPGLPWHEQVRALALSMHQAFSRHPVVPLALVTDQVNPTSLRAIRPLDTLVGALYGAGFDDVGAWRALNAVNGVVFGTLLLSTGGFTGDPGMHAGSRQVDAYVRELDAEALPHFSRLLRGTRRGVDLEADFRQALDVVITGLMEWNKAFRSARVESPRKGAHP